MAELLAQFQKWVESVIQSLGYPGIALLMFLENVFPPIPSEIIMPFSGFLVHDGRFNFWLVLLAGTIGSFLGALLIYYVGVWFSRERLRRWLERHGKWVLIDEKDFDHALEVFHRHGPWMVFMGRLFPGVRSIISIPAGLERMPVWFFSFLTIIGITFWNMLLIFAGMALGSQWRSILKVISKFELLIWLAILGFLIFFIYKKIQKRKKSTT